MTTARTDTMQVTETASTRKKRILLIDDDPSLLAFATFLLTKAGYQVSEARDGCEALQQVEERQV